MPSTNISILYDNRGVKHPDSCIAQRKYRELSENLARLGLSDKEEYLYLYDTPSDDMDEVGVFLPNAGGLVKSLFYEVGVSSCHLVIQRPEGKPFFLAIAELPKPQEAVCFHIIPASWAKEAYASELHHWLHAEAVSNSCCKQFLLECGLYERLLQHPMHAGFVDGILYYCSAEGASDGVAVPWMAAPASKSRIQSASRVLACYDIKSFDQWLDDSGNRFFLQQSERKNPIPEFIVDAEFTQYEYLWRKQKEQRTSLLSRGIEKALYVMDYETLHDVFEPFFDEDAASISKLKSLAQG